MPMPSDVPDVTILVPLFNDWEPFQLLMAEVDRTLAEHQVGAHVLVVDDGSTMPPPPDFASGPFQALSGIQVLELRRNLGHQRAIAIGLAYIEDQEQGPTVVIMDSDGEDAPRDIPRLLERYEQEGRRKIVFAERSRRSETFQFRLGYHLYRGLYRILTGRRVRFGNFSVVPRRRLASLVVVSDLWNHYVAAVLKSRQEYCSVPTHRGKRLRGESKTSLVNLIIHGLSAISVDSEIVGVRLLLMSLLLMVLFVVGLGVIVAIRLGTTLAIPGWATTAAGVLSILLFQSFLLATVFSFVILSGRQGSAFLPRRDYRHYIGRVYPVWPLS